MGIRDYTIYNYICRNATLYPKRDAIVFNDRRLTHEEYKEKCDHMGVKAYLIKPYSFEAFAEIPKTILSIIEA